MVEVSADHGYADVVAAQSDADVGRAEFVAHLVVVPQGLDILADLGGDDGGAVRHGVASERGSVGDLEVVGPGEAGCGVDAAGELDRASLGRVGGAVQDHHRFAGGELELLDLVG